MQGRNLKRRKGKLSSCIPSSSSQSSLLAIDRISTLPDPILHDILNLLPTKSVARTAALSKRFNALWLTNPILNFYEYDHCRKKHSDKLSNRMQRTYETHDFSLLQKLKFRSRAIRKIVNQYLSVEVGRFILRAVHADTLKELQIQFLVSKKTPTVGDLFFLEGFHRRFFLFPVIHLFSFCKSLKFLKLRGCRFEGNANVNYDGIILPFLKELVLKYCVIPDDNFVPKFIDGCPQLEKILFNFFLPRRKIQFSSSKLKELVLGCYDNTTPYEIEARNLRSLKITGTHIVDGDAFFQPEHIISVSNLDTLSFKNILLSNQGINRALSSSKSLKELEILSCDFTDEPYFESKEIEKSEILNCKFNDANLFISSSKLPRAKLVYLSSCTGLKNLTLQSRGLVYKVHACEAYREFRMVNI